MQNPAPVEAAHLALRTTGARVTQPRVQVLATLLGSERALSHHEIEKLLAGQSIDRVTVYRVLDWLVSQHMAYRLSGQDRIWRFGAVVNGQEHRAHFECSRCNRTIGLPDSPDYPVRLPAGYRLGRVQLNVSGLCAECSTESVGTSATV